MRTVSLVWPLSASAQRPSGSLTTPVGPLVNLVGRRLRDRTPKAWIWLLQPGLVTSGVLVLASVPVLVGVGRRTQPGNASVLPGHYPLALAVRALGDDAAVDREGAEQGQQDEQDGRDR